MKITQAFPFCAALITGLYCVQSPAADFTMDHGVLSVDTACSVTILPSTNKVVDIKIDGTPEDAEKFSITRQGGTISVKETGDACSTITGGNSVIVTGDNNISIVSSAGSITVNGKKITSRDTQSKNKTAPSIIIKAPAGFGLDAIMYGSPTLNATVPFSAAKLDLSGSTNASLIVEGGGLYIDMSGQGKVNTRGYYNEISIDISGMGNVATRGNVDGDYTVEASGMSNVSHSGKISGHIHQRTNGMSNVNFGD